MKFTRSGWTFSQVPIWAICDERLSPQAFRLFAYLAWRQGSDSYCWPSLPRIRQDTGLSLSTIRRQLRELEDIGYLETTHRPGRSSHYTLIADPSLGSLSKHSKASDKYTPVKVDRGSPSQTCRGTPVKADWGPQSELTGGAVKVDRHDDKIEQEENEQTEMNHEPATLKTIKATIRETMLQETYDQHFATAAAAPIENGILTIHLPSLESYAATNRLHTRLVARIHSAHGISIQFAPPNQRAYASEA